MARIRVRGLLTIRNVSILISSLLFYAVVYHFTAHSPGGSSQPASFYHLSASFSRGGANVRNRKSDTTDTFASYKHRKACSLSSLDLHLPFNPLCKTKSEVLTAMSSGGRVGFDAPYVPRGCDMRWYTTEEACQILGRWDKIVVTGDSMMRHLVGALNVILRKDLGYGAVTDWNFNAEEKEQCFCLTQFNVKTCSIQGIFKTADVEKHDPQSVKCGLGRVNVYIEEMVMFPIPPDELKRFNAALSTPPSGKPMAFIFGMGLWNALSVEKAIGWLDSVEENIKKHRPELASEKAFFPRLFVTPNAAGKEKLDEYIMTQGNKPLQIYEETMMAIGKERGMDVLGTWNATIQAHKWDGVHVDLRGNLLKAMMVLNWLDMLHKDMPIVRKKKAASEGSSAGHH